MVLLDTHILIYAIERQLRRNEERALDDFWAISSITLWEIAWLARERRIAVGPDDRRLRRVLDETTVLPIDIDVAMALRRLDFNSDPADEIIAATSIVHGYPLVTRDMRILSSKIVAFAH